MAALQGAQILTQDFSGYAVDASLSGSEILPGVTVTSSFANLVVWQDGSLFGYDDTTRIQGKGAYELRLSGYNAIGFDVVSWNPAAPGPARVGIGLEDGTSYEVEQWQRGSTEQTPVFFGIIATQSVVRIQWQEGPEVYGGGNEEVALDNLVCAQAQPGQPGEFLLEGIWEPDVYTGHASRLSIRQDASVWRVHGYGACQPTSCDWGEVVLNRVQPYNAGAFDGWFAVWEFGFKSTYAWLRPEGQGLKVETIDVFHDGSGRPPYSVSSRMHRVPLNTLAWGGSADDGSMVLKVARESGVRLQRCDDLSCANWTDVPLPEGEFEHVVPDGNPMAFYRLISPSASTGD
jgi:hypothetical protein